MATAREIEEAIAILLGGRVGSAAVGAVQQARAETKAFKALSRTAQIRAAGATAARGGKFVGRQAITKNPWGIAALLAYEGYIHRDEIADVAGAMGEGIGATFEGMGELMRGEGEVRLLGEKFPAKRKVSKANKAVKHAMGLLKAGPKRSTGADKGKLPKGAFKMATKAAGLANPKTKSKIGKGKGKLKALARKLRSWW
ncbi:MAG TPA: hypothetical protein EYN66_24280 [Myxococcales bacterium]|nr:hypothetical protein [Myxococcales bacterium]